MPYPAKTTASTLPAIAWPAEPCSRRAENTRKACKPAATVDKPMHIHRIECAKPCDLLTVRFLSSFGPLQTQALFSTLEIT
jgi:hypothetical protein